MRRGEIRCDVSCSCLSEGRARQARRCVVDEMRREGGREGVCESGQKGMMASVGLSLTQGMEIG